MSFVFPPTVQDVSGPPARRPVSFRPPRTRAGEYFPRARGARNVCRIPAGAPQQGCSPGPKMGGKSWPRLPGQFVRCDMPMRGRRTSVVTEGAPIAFMKPPRIDGDYGYTRGIVGRNKNTGFLRPVGPPFWGGYQSGAVADFPMDLDPRYQGTYGQGAVTGIGAVSGRTVGENGDDDDLDFLDTPAPQLMTEEEAFMEQAAASSPGVGETLGNMVPWLAGAALGFFVLPPILGKFFG